MAINSESCWLLNIGVLGPEMHHESEDVAKTFAAQYADLTGGPVPMVEPMARPCVTLRCAVCGADWEDADGYTGSHFTDTDTALSVSWRDGWTVLADGTTFCDACSSPANAGPVLRVPGQLALDGIEEHGPRG